MRSLAQKHSTPAKEEAAMTQAQGPARTRAGRLNEFFARWITSSALGGRFAHWLSKTISLPQLRRLAGAEIPWTPLRKPLSDSTVVLISTGGVHLRRDRPFNLNSDSTYRVIPRDAQPGDLAISHQAYDRTDALRDINLIFPIERLRELEAEHVIGRLTREHYGFGLMGSAARLMPSIKEVARRISDSGVDLALLVPACPICTRSVGLLAREIEVRGVTTVALALVKEVAVAARAPRFLYVHWPFGHALGEPGNVAQQRTVLHDMLSMATTAPRPGLVIDLPYRWRRETYPPVADWKTPSQAVVSVLSS